MADISKCSGEECPLKYDCWRHMAPSSEYWQAWFAEIPYNHDKKECPMFWDKTER